MFTGIIRTTGIVQGMQRGALSIAPKGLLRIRTGDSVAVNGACLTVEKKSGKTLSFSLMRSTVKTTTLGGLKKGDVVNLELPLKYGDRVDGHFVLGHVDGVSIITEDRPLYCVHVSPALKKYCVPKGSITFDGVSLTIVSVRGRDVFVSLTPYTLRHTRFAKLRIGDRVNVEVDIFARYLERFV